MKKGLILLALLTVVSVLIVFFINKQDNANTQQTKYWYETVITTKKIGLSGSVRKLIETEEKFDREGNRILKTIVFEFDNNGFLIKKSGDDNFKKFSISYNFTYKDSIPQNVIIKEISGNGIPLIGKINFNYDKNNLLLSETTTNEENRKINLVVYKYHNEQLKKMEFPFSAFLFPSNIFNNPRKAESKREFKYDENGNVISIIEKMRLFKNTEPPNIEEIEFDWRDDKILKEKRFNPGTNGINILSFNTKGHLIKQESYGGAMDANEIITFIYEYDKFNNWTKASKKYKSIKYNESTTRQITRTIFYY